MNSIKLVIDNKVLDEYNKYYFLCHPKARVVRIKEPYHPSINKWMIMQRQAMNDTKQRWKDFMCWFIEYCGYKDLRIAECEMIFTTYFKTTIRHDVDNTVPKFLLDGLAESGFIIDDDSKHLTSLTLKCDYDKDNPRTEIEIKILN
jgi:Holliday junction resolvase RusA-like endonuclease